MHSSSITAISSLLPFFMSSVAAHGYIMTPAARQPGQAFGAACGSQTLSQQSSDIFGNIQGELQVVGSTFDASKCNLWLCKGFQFSDQVASNIQSYTAGEVVPIHFDIRAPHNGVANISIVDTASNSIISELKSWDQFAMTSRPAQPAESDFEVTIPTDLGGKCAKAGDCVIQMFWDARSVDQTYESCIDFTVGGSGSGSGNGGVSSSAAVPVASGTSSKAGTRPTSSLAGTVEVTASATTNVNVVSSTTAAPVASSVASDEVEILTLTAGNTKLYCKEEL